MKVIEFKVNEPVLKMIQYNDGNIEYWVDDELLSDIAWGVYLKTDRKTFIDAFNKFEWVPKNCWNKEVRDKYKELENFIKETA